MVTLDPRAGKWVLLALFLSLGLNLFIGGFVVAHRFHRPPHEFADQRPPNERPGMHAFVDRMASTLPAADRDQFLSVIAGYKAEMATAEKQVHDARQKVRDAVAADPFDRTALESAFGDVRARMQDMQKVMHGALADAISHLSPDARKALAEWDKDKGVPNR
jgi:uncharacterized membrane protein